MFFKKSPLLKIAALGLSLTCFTSSFAQDFTKPVSIIVPFAPGANSDVLTRMLAQQVTDDGGPMFIIENKPGGGGAIGATMAKAAKPDGYTLFVTNTATHAILPEIQKVAFDPAKDFTPIGQLFYFPNFLIVPKRLPVSTMEEFIQYAKQNPDGLLQGSQGVGTPGHFLGAMLQNRTGINLVHVPYSGGGGPMNIDVLAGRLDLVFSTYASLKQQREDGLVKFLAIASPQRSPAAPDVPTLAELGIEGVELDAWFGLVAPAGTPDNIIQRFSELFRQAGQSPELVERFRTEGVTLAVNTPAEFAAQMAHDSERLAAVAKAADIRAD